MRSAQRLLRLVDTLSQGDLQVAQQQLQDLEGAQLIGGVIEPPGNGGRSVLLRWGGGTERGPLFLMLFRGTADDVPVRFLSNMAQNIDFEPTPYPDVFPRLTLAVHDGALEHAAPHMAVMRERLRGIETRDATLICAGFSLGGMAAQISAAWFQRNGGFARVRCVGIGCARTFRDKAATRLKRRLPELEIYAVRRDPIVRLPPGRLLYRHVVRPVCMDRPKAFRWSHSRACYLAAFAQALR